MLRLGKPAPDFALPNQDGTIIHLSDFIGKKVVLFAFPAAGTLGCNIQACGYRDEFPQLDAANTVVLGISTDSQEKLHQWRQDKNLPYDLLSDPDHQVLSDWGAWGIKLFGLKLGHTLRSHWIIDEQGLLVASHINVSPKGSVKEALEAVEEASHAEVR
jgi:thioredoxin-dependent peroxiredoxin